MSSELEVLAREVLFEALGRAARVAAVQPLQVGAQQVVLRVVLESTPTQLVLKVVAGSAAPAIDVLRTAAVMAMADAAGAPVPMVLGAGASTVDSSWHYLLTEYVPGAPWRQVCPTLDVEEVAAVHRALAEAVLAVQSVRFPAFGELSSGGSPAGDHLIAALRRRAELRVVDEPRRAVFLALLNRESGLFTGAAFPTLCHDDLHHGNVLLRPVDSGWRLAALLDWDKAWAGPAESDIARMALWDDMTGPGFWQTYPNTSPDADGADRRALIYQLLWCLEYDEDSPRHRADTAALCARLEVDPLPEGM